MCLLFPSTQHFMSIYTTYSAPPPSPPKLSISTQHMAEFLVNSSSQCSVSHTKSNYTIAKTTKPLLFLHTFVCSNSAPHRISARNVFSKYTQIYSTVVLNNCVFLFEMIWTKTHNFSINSDLYSFTQMISKAMLSRCVFSL